MEALREEDVMGNDVAEHIVMEMCCLKDQG